MRRHLGMSWADWQALPWWEQRALHEGLVRELTPDVPTVTDSETPEEEEAFLASAGFTLT